ncbi:xylan glycosyltransferase MUCI21-like [Aristolochia californica]|uniref:xylan glycosyltransferase MUCI21-like n=1 Tax=Aristolochia californica TaxID=171875 RepID=UPI0035DF29F9
MVSLLRFCPLIVFLFYSATSVFRFSWVTPPGIVLIGRDQPSVLKTHIKASETVPLEAREEEQNSSVIPCSSFINGIVEERRYRYQKGTLCCDRSHYRTDICYMKGDIRTDSPSSSILLYNGGEMKGEELIRPYTRKWEVEIMKTIDELRLRSINGSLSPRQCDVKHQVPAVVISTGGYTGNVYHEFNDGLLPLYLTIERFKGEVVVVVVEFHNWWLTKYESVVKKLTNYQVVDFSGDPRVRCFPEVIVGLKIHGELAVNPSIGNGKTIQDFRALIADGFQVSSSNQLKKAPTGVHGRPTLAIFIRNKSRQLLNLREIEKTCRLIGFEVVILNPRKDTPLADIFAVLNSADAMLGVHGAALTHFLFMKPNSVFIQIVPLGLSWAAEEYYGQPARKLGLEYMDYNITAEESSLSRDYGRTHPVLVDPTSVNKKGWSETKRIYLQKQNVRVDIKRFRRVIAKAYSYLLGLN